MESIGAELKGAREAKGISIEQAQKETRIHVSILRALEEDRIEEASSTPIYIKSFIRKYADYLGLDGASLADEYLKGHPQFVEQKLSLESERTSFKFPARRLISVGIIILIALLGFGLLFFLGSRVSAKLKSPPKVVKVSEAEKSKQATKTISSEAKILAPVQIPKGENLILTIKARQDAWLKVVLDGTVIYDDIIKKGSQESWKATKTLEISTGRAEALIAELNGAKLEPFGKGIVKGILITKDGLKLPK